MNIHGANVVLFADGINMLITDSDIGALQDKINKVTTELEYWLNKNKFVINTNKTGIMSIQNYQRDALNTIYSSNIITLLYMFRVSSTHLQEDIVVHKQHMVSSLYFF